MSHRPFALWKPSERGYVLMLIVLFAIGFFITPTIVDAANLYWVGGNGDNVGTNANDWATIDPASCADGTGDASAVPGTGDVAIFDADCDSNATIAANWSVGGVNMNSGYIGTVTQNAGVTYTIGSSNYVQAGGTFTGGDLKVDINGTFTLSGGVYTATSGTTESRSFTHSAGGTFEHSSGTWKLDFAGVAIVIDVATSETFGSLEVDVGGYNLDPTDAAETLVVTGTLTLTDGILDSGMTIEARGTTTIAATWDGGAGTIALGGSATYTATIATVSFGSDYNAITIDNPNATLETSGTAGAFSFTHDFTLTNGTFTNSNNSDITFVSGVSDYLQSGGTFNAGSGGSTVDVVFNKSFLLTGGTFNGQGTSIRHGSSSTFEIQGGTYNATTATTTHLTSFTHTVGGTFAHSSGTWDFASGGSSATINVITSETFGAVTISKAGYSMTITSGDTIVVTGALILGDIVLSSGTIEAQGDVTVQSTLDAGSTTALTFSGSGTQSFDLTGATALFDSDITVNKSGGQVNLASALVMNAADQDLTIVEGTFDLAGQNLTVNGSTGDLNVESGGTLQLQGGETLTLNSNEPTLDAGSTLSYDGTSGPYTIKDFTYTNATLALNGASTFNAGATETVTGLTIASGATFDLTGQTFTVSSTFSNEGTFVLNGDETLTLTPGNDTNSGLVKYESAVTATGLLVGNTYYDLEIAGAALTLNATLDVNRNLTISSGSLLASANAITLGGNWTNSGTFTHGNNTVTLDGTNQTLNAGTAGTLTFYDLIKNVTAAAQLTLDDDDTFTISNDLTWTGQSGQLLTVRTDVDDTPADMSVVGTVTVSYLSVRDLNNTGTTIACMTGCTNGGGNTGWIFASSATPSSITYQDNDSNGTVDRVVIDFGAAVTLTGTVASTRLTWVSSSGANGFAGSLSGNASVEEGDVVVMISSTEADETGHTTQPTLAYSDNSDDVTNYIADGSGDIIQTFTATNVSDGAKPRAKTATFYDAASSDGKLDLMTVVFTENISAVVDGSADWAVSSAANFSSLVEGTVECNSGSAGANECDYNFTTSTVKTNVGDLTLTYTAGTSVTDGTNTAATIALSSASTPAFTDGAAPEAIDAQISIAGGTGTSGAYKIGDAITATWNAANSSDINAVTADLSGWGGSATATMTDTTACGGTASDGIWEACYIILGSEGIDTTSVNVTVDATDNSTNNRTNADTSNATVDTVAPTVSAGNISVTGAGGTSGAFKFGDTAVPTWNNTALGDNNTDTITSVFVSAANFRTGDTALSASDTAGTWTASLSDALTLQDDTSNNVTMTVTDNAGNETATAGTNDYVIDTIVPVVTGGNISVTGAGGTSGAFKSGDTAIPTWDVTTEGESDTLASVTFDGSSFNDDSSSVAGSVGGGIYSALLVAALDLQDDTGNTITVTVVDNAGNSTGPVTSTPTYTIDTIVPIVTVGSLSVTGSSGTAGAFKFDDTQTYVWNPTTSGESDTLASVSFNGSSFKSSDTAASGALATNWTAVSTLDSQDDTLNTITATVVDNAGNSTTSSASTASYTIDTIVPVVTQASITVAGATGTGGAFKNGNSPVLTWNPTTSGESDIITSATFNGANLKSGDTLLTGSLSTNWTASLSGAMDSQDDTSNTITVTVIDNAGNSTGPTTSSTSYTIDTIIPTLVSITYKDVTSEDGTVDRVDVVFSEGMSTGFVADKDEWTFPTAGTVSLIAPSLDASVTVSTTTVSIVPASAAANATGGATAPTLTYMDTDGTLVDDAGNAPANFSAQTVADGAAPRVKSSSGRYTLDNNSNGTVDYVKLVFTESVLDSSVAAGDFCVSTTSGSCTAGDLTEAFTSLTPSIGNETDTANDATIYVGISAGTQSITTNKTDYTLAVQVIGTVTDATPNTSSAEGSATNSTDGAAPVAVSASYKDVTSVDGMVDRVDVLFTEALTLSSYDASDWSFPIVSELTLADTGASVSTSTLLLTVSADANETGHTTAPTVRYTNNSNRFSDGTNNTATFASDITVADAAGPFLLSSSPEDADMGVQANADIVLTFTEGINTTTFDYSCCGTALDPGNRSTAWTVGDTIATITHNIFAGSSQVTINITTASDGTGNTFQGALTGAVDPFTFTIISSGDRAYRTENGTTGITTATVLSPNGGETLSGGTMATITWSATASGLSSITLSYATNNRTYITIATGEANDGEYEWTVPNGAATTVRVKVSAVNGDGQELVSDTSNGVFTITATSTSGADSQEDADDGTSGADEEGSPQSMMTPDGVVVTLSEGSLFRGVTLSDVYLVKDGTRYVFPSESVYFSYYDSFDDVVLVNDDQLRKLALGERIIMASGRMIKIQSDNRVFQTQNNRVIRHIPDEATARALYGSTWARQITDISVVFWGDYTVKEALASLR